MSLPSPFWPVQPTGLDLEQQVNEISRDFRTDWVTTNLFGSPVPVSIKEFRKAGYSLDCVMSFVYGAGYSEVEEAGWDAAQGYLGVHHAALGRDLSLICEIARMYREQYKEPPRFLGSAWVPVTGWTRAYRDQVMELVKGANARAGR